MPLVAVTASFDDLRCPHVRFLEEAAKLGDVYVRLWSDATVQALAGRPPKFPQEERQYVAQALRYVRNVTVVEGLTQRDELAGREGPRPHLWAVNQADANPAKERFCAAHGLGYRVIPDAALQGFPVLAPPPVPPAPAAPGRKKVIVTGCYDWLHSGHVRFFEEVAELGDLYVVVGHDANLRLLKGEGHPLFPQDLRRYMAQAIRYVKQALISTGAGWMDAEPEIARLRPDMYAVNEDGDRPEKRAFCAQHGLEYVVLRRLPKAGLPRRQSTALRGF